MLKYLCLFLILKVVSSQEEISNCPNTCSCTSWRICRNLKSSKCLKVLINCHAESFTSIPERMSLDATVVLLSSNNIEIINLNAFQNLTKLTALALNNNNATTLIISEKIKKLQRLSLINNRLSSLPRKSLSQNLRNLRNLNLNNNLIHDIDKVRFPQRLERLNLNNNRIESLTKSCFSKLKALQVLKINNNRISTIRPKAFAHLRSLQSLEMENNDLQILPRNVFSPLVKAWYLNLRNNRINEMHHESFQFFGSRNENHRFIHLENNQLKFIEKETIAPQIVRDQERYTVYVAGNPIYCDCNLVNFLNETQDLLGDKNTAFCDSPHSYAGVSVQNLFIDECCF